MNYELDSKMYNGKRIQPQAEWENNNTREFINTNNYYIHCVIISIIFSHF